MSAPVITSVGLVTPLAHGRAEFVDAWRSGAIAAPEVDGPLAESLGAGRLKLRPWFPEQRNTLRRMDRLSKLMCLAAALARDDGGFGDCDALALGVGTDLGTLDTTWSFLHRLREKGPALANPMDFPNLVPNAGAGYVGIFCGLRGPSHTFCQHETAGDDAVAWGADLVRSGAAPGALVGGAEELSEVRLQAMRRVGCRTHRTAEGAAVFLVEAPGRAAARGAVPLAAHLGSLGACGKVGAEAGLKGVDEGAAEALVARLLEQTGQPGRSVGAILASDPTVLGPARAALGHDAPATDHVERTGQHPGDGGLRIALAALLVADRSLPVHAGADGIQGDAALVLSAARGGGLRATLIGALP